MLIFVQKENSTCKTFQEQKPALSKSHEQKISIEQIQGTKLVSRGEKSMYTFHKEKNQHVISLTKKN